MARRKLQPGELSRDGTVAAAREVCAAEDLPFPGVREIQRWYKARGGSATRDDVADLVRSRAGTATAPPDRDPVAADTGAVPLPATPDGIDIADVGAPPMAVLAALGNSAQAFSAFQSGCRVLDERRHEEWRRQVERAEYVHHDTVVECLRTPDHVLAEMEVAAGRWNHSPQQTIRLARERIAEALNDVYQREIGSRRAGD